MLLVANQQSNTIGEYNAATGATIQTPFITATGNGFHTLAVDGHNHLFESNSTSTVGEYNATTGAAINTTFINGQGVSFRGPMALDGNNHLFVEAGGNPGSWVAEYDALTGATINANFVNLNQGLQVGEYMAVDKVNNHLFVGDYNDVRIRRHYRRQPSIITLPRRHPRRNGSGRLQPSFCRLWYGGLRQRAHRIQLPHGAVINPAFITGFSYPLGLALDDNNHLFVTRNDGNTTVGEYNATTGATISTDFINGQGLDQPGSIVFVSSVPEPSTFALAGIGVLSLLTCIRQRRRRSPYYLNRPKASVT